MVDSGKGASAWLEIKSPPFLLGFSFVGLFPSCCLISLTNYF